MKYLNPYDTLVASCCLAHVICRVSKDANAASDGATEYSRLLPSSKERRLSVRPYKKYSSTSWSWNYQDDSGDDSSDDGLASEVTS